ncbi:MAG: cupin domain-containing protein, partial [Acidimicrobiia bacterium]|nr:cupin domain-containing protein [Acidimicrobiia bacterium]
MINCRSSKLLDGRRTMPETTTPTPSPRPPADPLGEVLHLLRLTGTLYCRAELTSPWGIAVPEIEDCMVVHIVTAGHCRIELDGEAPRELREGSLVLLPHGSPHTLRSGPDAEADPLFDL